MSGLLRRIVPLTLLPLALVACGLASAPWLRAYPASVLAAPLFGATLLSVMLPFVVVNIGVRKLWQTALIDVLGFLFFVTLVALRRPLGYPELWSGLVHGPSQILSYALPLVSPRSLLVVPVTLCWLCGAVVGECVARAWQSVVPYLTVLVTFVLAYAGTQRAVTDASTGRRFDTVLGAALLLCLLLLRAVQAWIAQEDAAEVQPEGLLPVRSVALGAVISVLVAGAAALAVQSHAFAGHVATPARTPPIAATTPLSPLSFVAGLRPGDLRSKGTPLFTMTVDGTASRYVSIGDVDVYNGDSWSFARTFRPSGGVVPPDPDPALRPPSAPVTQQYTITGDALVNAPWMPFEFRPQRVIGAGVDIDPGSGMIVPSSGLHVGDRYSVVSDVALRTFGGLKQSALPGTSYQSTDLQLPVQVTTSLAPVISAFAKETGTSSGAAVPFLQALAADLHANYGLVGGPPPPGAGSSGSSGSGSGTAHPTVGPTPSAAPSPTASQAPGARPGGTSFAAVLASILGTSRTATPEQYATLVALIARQLNVPARVVTGFRIPTSGGASTIAAGTYDVTTADAWTWVEIPIQGQGWVVLDPSPGQASAQHPTHTAGASRSPQPTSSPAPATLITVAPSKGGTAVGPKGRVSKHQPVSVLAVVVGVLVVLALLLLVGVVVALVRKWLRLRRRQRAGDARRQVVGAWLETLDVLVESGLPDPSALTSAEVGTAAEEAFGPEPAAQARAVGRSANLAIFSPSAAIRSDDAEAAWRAHTALRRAVRRRLPLAQRVRSRLRYHRPRRGRTVTAPASWTAGARSRTVHPEQQRRSPNRRRAH